MNAAIILEDTARTVPDKVAVIDGEQQYSYAEVNALANRVANGLRAAGVGKGDRVVFSCLNSIHFLALYFGTLKLGAIAVPINTKLRHREIEYALVQSGAAAYVCHAGAPDFPVGREGLAAFAAVDSCRHFWMIPGIDASAPVPDVPLWDALVDQSADFESVHCAAGDPAEIMYSSGTTGRPKGTLHSIGALIINEMNIRNRSEYTRADITLAALPFYTTFCRVCAVLPTILSGGTLVTAQKFKADETWKAIVRHKVTVFPGVPMIYAALLEAESVPALESLSHWRLALSSGMVASYGLQTKFKERTGVVIRQLYGMSEVRVCTQSSGDVIKSGSAGRPLWGVAIRCLDDQRQPVPPGQIGSLVVGGPNVMIEYFNDPDATAAVLQNGWLDTGDTGFIDEAGEIHIVGRTKDMITRGGNHVFPAEVEQSLLTHPAIADAAVVGAPDERLGEEVCAFVVLKEGQRCGSADLVAWARENIAAQAWPRRIQILPALPTNSMGKILKTELRGRLMAPLPPDQPAQMEPSIDR